MASSLIAVHLLALHLIVAVHRKEQVVEKSEDTMKVVQWNHTRTKARDKPECSAWVVYCYIADKNRRRRIWTSNADQFKKLLKDEYGDAFNLVFAGHLGGFVNGQFIKKLSIPIHPCGPNNTPRFIYRVHHAKNWGLRSRSYFLNTSDTKYRADPLLFQVYVQSHLCWHSRRPSFFMSVTTSHRAARNLCSWYEGKGKKGIHILVIDTTAPGWDHSSSRMWHLPHLVDVLDFQPGHKVDEEYIVEHEMPESAVLIRIPWDAVRHILDPGARQVKKYKYNWEYRRLYAKAHHAENRAKRLRQLREDWEAEFGACEDHDEDENARPPWKKRRTEKRYMGCNHSLKMGHQDQS